jgi:hypothetical protein
MEATLTYENFKMTWLNEEECNIVKLSIVMAKFWFPKLSYKKPALSDFQC